MTRLAVGRLDPRDERHTVVISGEHDFEYHPVLAEASEFLRASRATRFLLVGEPLGDGEGLPHGFEEVADCRHRHERDAPESLPTGNYRLHTPAGCAVMLVTSGAFPAGPQHGDATPGGDTFLDRANAWFEHLWTEAEPIPRPAFPNGAVVVTVPGGQETSVRSKLIMVHSKALPQELKGRVRSNPGPR